MTPIDTLDLFPLLRHALIGLLRRLADDDWLRPTAARLWSVRDVAAHLLDGDLRRLAFHRDRMPPPPFDRPVGTYRDLVEYLDGFNASWVKAARRLSPRLLTDLLAWTGPQVEAHLGSLDPAATAVFAVAWAGEDESPNWFDIAREYTERWHHQQQIRDAVGAAALTEPTMLHPVIDTFLRGLPHAYRSVDAAPGTRVTVSIAGEAGGDWTLVRDGADWTLYDGSAPDAGTSVVLDQDAAWRLFTKGLSRDAARERMRVAGDSRLAEGLLSLVAVMG